MNYRHNIEIINNEALGYFKEYTLHSVFQPIYSFAHAEPVGYEALLRATNSMGENIPPVKLFSTVDNDNDELLKLEQLSRSLHLLNFDRQNTGDALLFLNINPHLIDNNNNSMKQLIEILHDYNISPRQIVIEIVEELVCEYDNLVSQIQYLKMNGCMLAIDDFGAGHSNFNRIWDLNPDIVKLDKAMIKRLKTSSDFLRPFSSLVELLHGSGALVLIEGVEDEEDAELAHDMDVDFHQGYFFAHPVRELSLLKNVYNPYLTKPFQDKLATRITPRSSTLPEHLEFLFNEIATSVQFDNSLKHYCERLLNHPRVLCCYLLDDQGYQIADKLYGYHATQLSSSHHRALDKNQQDNWSRRSYYQRAMASPMTIQISRPYKSLTNLGMCVTLSIAVEMKRKLNILCCDITWQDIKN